MTIADNVDAQAMMDVDAHDAEDLQGGAKTPPSDPVSFAAKVSPSTPSKKVAQSSVCSPPPHLHFSNVNSQGQSVVDEAANLVTVLQNLLDKAEVTILLSFDEAHTLTKPLKNTPSWSPHFSARSALRSLRHQPIFAVFLSTTGRFYKFVPAAADDPSRRRIQTVQLRHHTPICGLGYDLMARGFVVEGKRSLDEYATDKSMSRFGRPL